MPPLVPSIGPLSAKIVLVLEAPSENDVKENRPLAGGSGQLLKQLLSKTGINVNECYITFVHKSRPPFGDFSRLYQDPKKKAEPTQSLSDSINFLHSELRGLRPNVLIPLGGEALRALTRKHRISKWRGSIIPSPFGKCVPTLDPAYLLRSFSEVGIASLDLRRAWEQSKFPEIRDLGLKLETNPSFERVHQFLSGLLSNPKRIAVDIESSRKTNHVRCIGFASSGVHAICIPFVSRVQGPANIIQLNPVQTEWKNHWTEEQETQILFLLDGVFRDPRIEKVLQNGPFDTQVLQREFGFVLNGIVLDTMAAMYTMYPEMPKDLSYAASVYTEIPFYADHDHDSDAQEWEYNLLDCIVTYQTAEALEKDLAQRSAVQTGLRTQEGPPFTSSTFYHNHLHPAFTTMCRVGQRGVLQDLEERDRLLKKYQDEMQEYVQKFNDSIRAFLPPGVPDINPASPQQLMKLFYTYLKMKPERNHKTKALTTDEDAVEALTKKYPEHVQLFNNLLHWRKRQKLVSTYLQCILTKENRLVTSYNAVGTVGGRCSSSKTVFNGKEGANHQNFPSREWTDLLKEKWDLGKPLRKMFIADPGYVLIKTDLSQAQFRISVWDAPVLRLIERYRADPNFDVHKWVASLIYKVSESEVSKAQRSIAKNGVYGGNFGMEAKKAALTYGLALKDAEFVLREYRQALPEIPLWWEKVKRILVSCRTLISPLGRIRVFHDRLDDSTFREAYAHICQAVEADIIHRASIIVEAGLLPRCEVSMQIHDELVLQCHESTLDENLPRIKRIMEYPVWFPGVSEPLIIPADISVGKNWGETRKWSGEPKVDSPCLAIQSEEPVSNLSESLSERLKV